MHQRHFKKIHWMFKLYDMIKMALNFSFSYNNATDLAVSMWKYLCALKMSIMYLYHGLWGKIEGKDISTTITKTIIYNKWL